MVRWRRMTHRARFRRFGTNVYLFDGIEFDNPAAMEIGDGVIIQRDGRFGVASDAPGMEDTRLAIGRGSNIGARNHVFARAKVTIGEKVLTAPNVFISDCTHAYGDVTMPILDQPVLTLSPTHIGDHSWIGQGAVIIGCSIGRHCVIGANAVVLSDVPDNCIVVGAPARIVRRYDPTSGKWCNFEELPRSFAAKFQP